MSYQYRLRKEREMERRAPYYALLDAIIAGGYTPEGAKKYILEKLEEAKSWVLELASKTDEEFYREHPLAMVPRSYALENARRSVEFFQSLLKSIDYYVELCKENPGLIDLLIKRYYVGRVREAREAFRRFCGNITGGLTRFLKK